MSEMAETPPANGWTRKLPLMLIAVVAVIGYFTLREYLSFQTLAENREALIAFGTVITSRLRWSSFSHISQLSLSHFPVRHLRH